MEKILLQETKEALKIWETYDFYGMEDFTYVVARTEADAILALAQSCGYATSYGNEKEKEYQLKEFFEDCRKPEVKELNQNEYDSLMFVSEDKTVVTFRKQLSFMIENNPNQFPVFFATNFEG